MKVKNRSVISPSRLGKGGSPRSHPGLKAKAASIGAWVQNLMRLLVELKIYHWGTESFARHKASDQCFTDLQTLIDRFMEAFLGSRGARPLFEAGLKHQHPVLQVPLRLSLNDRFLEDELRHSIEFLREVHFTQTDLMNIRDEMLSVLHTCLYLFTLE